MDRRTLLAVVLMALVLIVGQLLFPSRRQTPNGSNARAAAGGGTTSAVPSNGSSGARTAAPVPPVSSVPSPTAGSASPARAASAAPSAAAPTRACCLSADTLITSRARLVLANPGASPIAAHIPSYRDLNPRRKRGDSSVAVVDSATLLSYRLARGTDTVALDTLPFTVARSANGQSVTFSSAAITIAYEPTRDGYRTAVRATVPNAPPGSALLIDLPETFKSVEADTLDDERHLAYAYKIPLRDVSSISFSKLDTTARADTGSFQWVAARSKYWLVALMQPVGEKPAGIFRNLVMRRDTTVGKIARTAHATTAAPITNGQLAFDLYIGPQSWQELHALGNDMENVNPYAGWLHAVVQPFATIIMRILLWMKATFPLSYGWVLVLFGVVIRLLLWPLNQKAMRTSIQMQRLQPELTEVQKRYKNEPEKQREALVKLYQSHGMSPFSPMLGCLPMLLPMPVLYALYYVFQNTIELRGVPFLWLPDLSLRDPTYIIPIVMGASMFLLSWIGMRAMPSNPQTKMMSYMMPALFTFMFLNFASGLNLYYAVQNIAALPQQWMITRERAKAGVPQQTQGRRVGGSEGQRGGVRRA